MNLVRTLAIAVVALVACAAQAAPVYVANHDFETTPSNPSNPTNDPLQDNDIYREPLADWTRVHHTSDTPTATSFGVVNPGGGGSSNPYSFYSGASDSINGGVLANMDGPNVGYINTGGRISYYQQVLSATLQPLTKYTLTVAVGVRDNGNVFGGYNVIFGTTGSPALKYEQTTAAPGDPGGFYDIVVEFTTGDSDAQLGEQIQIRLGKYSGLGLTDGYGKYTDFDNVRLDATSLIDPPGVPAPAALPAGLALIGALAVRRRRA